MMQLSSTIVRILVEDFLKSSHPCLDSIVNALSTFRGSDQKKFAFFRFKNDQRNDTVLDGTHFFLRSSVEYSNPQLTVEEVQGIIAARLLEVCGNYLFECGPHQLTSQDLDEICCRLKETKDGLLVAFLLNTDDIEADRYSMNPLKESIVTSEQSALPAWVVKTSSLEVDQKFAQKYDGSLISKQEIDLIERHIKRFPSYMDMVDAVKYEQLAQLSEAFDMNLCMYSTRMPLSVLEKETNEGWLHNIIKKTHADYEAIERVYKCMGRSMKNLTTLLTVPHSRKGYGSKRAVRGRVYFDGTKLKSVKVDYRTVLLYPNAIDPSDVSAAKADDSFIVPGEQLVNYSFKETPSSPQFFLYSLASPEDAVLWHGIGAFGASELLKSYTTIRAAASELITGANDKYSSASRVPLQFNLDPKHMWGHPVHHNIDASIGSVPNLTDLANIGMKLEPLPVDQYIRK